MGFRTIQRFGNSVALIDAYGRTLSFVEVASLADKAAPPGPRKLVGIACRNDIATILAFLGSLRAGHAVLLLNEGLQDLQTRRILDDYGIAWLHESDHGWTHSAATSADMHPDLAILLSTSGSTGSPKFVRIAYSALTANAASIIQALDIVPCDVAITSLPVCYSYGLSVLNSHLLCGAAVVLSTDAVTTPAFWQAFRKHKVTNLAGVPTTHRMLRQLRIEKMNLPSLRTVTQAGGGLLPEEIRWCIQTHGDQGRRFIVMYGQTEATARISYVPWEFAESKAGSIGIAIPNGRMELIDDAGLPLESTGSSAELAYRGPNVMMGYATNKSDLERGYDVQLLRTGDTALRDADGFFWLTGRKNRFIKVNGNRIALDEVETSLREMGFSVTVAGVEDVLLVVSVELLDVKQITDAIWERYRLRAPNIRIEHIRALPVSPSGKILYQELINRFCS